MAKTKERSPFWVKPILWINYFFIILLLLSNLNSIIAPDLFWPISILGLAFPIILLTNVFFFFLWILFKKKYLFYSALAILISYSIVFDHVQFRESKESNGYISDTLKIVSFNARNLSNTNISIGDKYIRGNILDFMMAQKADFICFQEFQSYPTRGVYSVREFKINLQHKYYHQTPYLLENTHEFVDLLVMYSRFPIQDSKDFYMDGKSYGFWVDVNIEGKIYRLFNLHLESNHFNKNDYDIFSNKEVNLNQKKRNQMFLLVQKIKKYSVKRSYQARTIRTEIENSPYPVIVAGDYNDTPASYTYQHIRGDLKDAFKQKYVGYSNTYNGNLPPMRIDYLLFDSQVDIHDYEVLKPDFSDHFPITTKFTIP